MSQFRLMILLFWLNRKKKKLEWSVWKSSMAM